MSEQGGPTDDELWGPTGSPSGASNPPPTDDAATHGSPVGSDPTLVSPALHPGGGGPVGAPPGGQPPNLPGGGEGPVEGDGGSKQPAWLVPAAAGLIVGLLVALIAFALTRGGDDEEAVPSTTPSIDTSAPPTMPGTSVGPSSSTSSTASSTTPESTTSSAAPTTSAAPPSTTAPATTTTATISTQPTTTLAPGGVSVASPGTVRILDQEFPILRACASQSFGFGFSTVSYLFDNGGFVDIVERWFDEGSSSGFYGDSYDLVDLGDDGFGMLVVEGDSEVPISVNPGSGVVPPCPGAVVLTDPANPDFPTSLGIVDICFGTFGPDDRFGYRARLSEGAEFTAAPSAGASLAVSISTRDFAGDDPAATSSAPASGEAISGTAVGGPGGVYAGQSRAFEASWGDEVVRECVAGSD